MRLLHGPQVGQLRAERARYERALRREVGDDVPLARVLDKASDWRGRAQQITLLQERLLSIQEAQACPLYCACMNVFCGSRQLKTSLGPWKGCATCGLHSA